MELFDSKIHTISSIVNRSTSAFLDYLDEICDRIDEVDILIQSFIPEPGRRTRLKKEALSLIERFPDPDNRPPLFGIPVGIKDIFRVNGFPTRCGSKLPPELFAGPEAECIAMLRKAGALPLGKTVTTEFAYFEPGPTRNPHNTNHTPGGSSSGSAAAVAAGFCPLALGTQTIGSIIRPAAYCGIIGFKPSYDRIPMSGIIPYSISADHAGIFTQDIAGMKAASSIICTNWKESEFPNDTPALPVLGVPEGPYLDQASPDALGAFEGSLLTLKNMGYTIKRISIFEDLETITLQHQKMISAEMAELHSEWFDMYEDLYRPRTAALIREGRTVSSEELESGRRSRQLVRTRLEEMMRDNSVDLFISPSATGTAPEGISSTGNPAMNLPWTHAGMPSITIPSGHAGNSLPYGLQIIARFMEDEYLLFRAENLERNLISK